MEAETVVNRLVTLLFLGCVMCAAADLPFVCTPAKVVVGDEESIQVSAWLPEGSWAFAWKSSAGTVISDGPRAVWNLTGVEAGERTIEVSATGAGGKTLTCSARVWVEKGVEIRGDRVARRFLLSPAGQEPDDYGLYSYVLLTPDAGDPVARNRNLEAIRSWFTRYMPSVAAERMRSRSALIAAFVPTTEEAANDPDADWVFGHYDYRRADRLLASLDFRRTGGPYLVAQKQPLSKGAVKPALILDGGWAPPSTIRFWMQAFYGQSFQERFDQPRSFDLFNLKLRTIISVFAQQVPQAAGSVISLAR
jgi:hypothetical protein